MSNNVELHNNLDTRRVSIAEVPLCGKRINYIDKDGNVLKSETLSYSPYKDKYKSK